MIGRSDYFALVLLLSVENCSNNEAVILQSPLKQPQLKNKAMNNEIINLFHPLTKQDLLYQESWIQQTQKHPTRYLQGT